MKNTVVEGTGSEDGLRIDWQHHTRTLRKYRLPIVIFTLLATLLAVLYVHYATPIYSAEATLLIEEEQTSFATMEEQYDAEAYGDDYYFTQFELLKSRHLAERVIETLDLWRDPLFSDEARGLVPLPEAAAGRTGNEDLSVWASLRNQVVALVARIKGSFTGGAEPAAAGKSADSGVAGRPEAENNAAAPPERGFDVDRDAVVGEFIEKLRVAPVRSTTLVKIHFESPDPEQAALVANTVARTYITDNLESRMETATEATGWLRERVETLKSSLNDSEDRLARFRDANGLVDLEGGVGSLNEQELLNLSGELSRARREVSNQRDLIREIDNLENAPGSLESIGAIQSDPEVQEVKIEQGAAQRQLESLRNRYGERHPLVVDAATTMQTLEGTLEDAISRVVNNIRQEFVLAQERVNALTQEIAAGKSQLQVIGNKKFELESLQAEVETNRELYNTYLNRLTESGSAEGIGTTNARVSDRATVPDSPIKPQTEKIILLVTLGALLLSAMMALVYEMLDDAIKSTEDVKRLGLAMLGVVPVVKRGLFSSDTSLPLDPVQMATNAPMMREALNTVRTVLTLKESDSRFRTIMITSSTPGEGKSTAALSLAYSYSRFQRVLLIDCDMRKPTIAEAAGLARQTDGLSNVLTRSMRAGDTIRRDVFDGAFDILPSGVLPLQPLEMLSSPRFANLLKQLESHYDRILIDCAPLQAASDALVIAQRCDAVVYVVKSHETSFSLAKGAIDRLRQAGANIAGALITQVDVNKLATYGEESSYYGYYDLHSYGAMSSQRLTLTADELHEMQDDHAALELGLSKNDGTEHHSASVTHLKSAPSYRSDAAIADESAFTAHRADSLSTSVPVHSSSNLRKNVDSVRRRRQSGEAAES